MIRYILPIAALACFVHFSSAYDWSAQFASISGGESAPKPSCTKLDGEKPCTKKAGAMGDCTLTYTTSFETPQGFIAKFTVDQSTDVCIEDPVNCKATRDYVVNSDCVKGVVVEK
jgi:hypothetical protein